MDDLSKVLNEVAIDELVRYTVQENDLPAALAVVDRYRYHRQAAATLRTYYSQLPEGREEMAADLRLVAEKEGYFLIGLATPNHRYLFIASGSEAVLLGDFDKGVQDEGVLQHFGCQTAEELAKTFGKFHDLKVLPGAGPTAEEHQCVACGAVSGTVHALGCPVELCPWCEGQVSRCNCRFDQLGVDVIDSEELLDRFAELLEEKGRIPFQPGQNPSYPRAGDDGPSLEAEKDRLISGPDS